MENYLLALFVPGRRDVGTLRAAFEKFGVQYVDDCAEPTVTARYADAQGLLLTLAAWTPAAVEPRRGGARITLPESVLGLLTAVHGVARDGFDVTLVTPARGIRNHAQIKLDRLAGPLALGCRYQVAP